MFLSCRNLSMLIQTKYSKKTLLRIFEYFHLLNFAFIFSFVSMFTIVFFLWLVKIKKSFRAVDGYLLLIANNCFKANTKKENNESIYH